MPEFNDAQQTDKKPEKRTHKMKSSTTKGDAIDKGKTVTGSKPDIINTNPVLEKVFANISKIYNQVIEKVGLDRNDTHLRDSGTSSLVSIYKSDTPGQAVDKEFALRFKDPKKDKEAFTRSGQTRKYMDLVPRTDKDRNRETDSDFYRQQSIVKKIIEAKNPFKKDPWTKMLERNPKHAESERKAQEAKAGLEQNKKDYESIVQKKKTNEDTVVNEISQQLAHSFVSHMMAAHPDTVSASRPKGRDIQRRKALDLALDKEHPKSAIHKPHVIATEDTINEIGDTPKGQYRLQSTKMRASARAGSAAGEEIVGHHGYKPDEVKKNNKIAAQASKRITPLSMSPSSDAGLEEDKAVWDKANPKKHHGHMSRAEVIKAKAKAKAAGRPYPNLVDNMAAVKEDVNDMFEEFAGCPINEESDIQGIVEFLFTSSGDELYEDWNEVNEEAEHQGRKVKLGKPFLTPGGPKKRAVYVKNASGNVVKVNFGDPHLSIKRDQPTRRSSYRARHHCETPGPRWKANYWSCKYWSSTPASTLDKG